MTFSMNACLWVFLSLKKKKHFIPRTAKESQIRKKRICFHNIFTASIINICNVIMLLNATNVDKGGCVTEYVTTCKSLLATEVILR